MKNSISSIAFLERAFPVLVLLASLAFVQGCAEYQVRIPSSHPDDINYKGGIMKAWLWGKWVAPEVLAAECQTEGINDVVVKRNYLHDLASVFTFGIFMPIEVNFRCESASAVEGDVSDFDIPDPE